MFRFLHASDLHLGKPFGRFPEEVRGVLAQARQGVVGRLAEAARGAGAGAVILAGDTFDSGSPSARVLRQAVNAMAAAGDLRWFLLPGNHDSLAADELWRRLAAEAPGNVVLMTDPGPVEVAGDVWLLPAPATVRRPGRDLTEAMAAPTPEGAIRIGVGHGAVTSFAAGEVGDAAVIPPDRDRLSGLDYLALGDWHGQVRISARVWYPGTAETDGFKHGGRGRALTVTVAGRGAEPEVAEVTTGICDWRRIVLALVPGDDAADLLTRDLPGLGARGDMLVRVQPEGRIGLGARAALERAVAAVAPDFLWLETAWEGLALVQDLADLDRIGTTGALRRAAERLAAEAEDPGLSAERRAVASAALLRLHGFAVEEEGP